MEGGGRKRGKLDRANGASAGGKRARETESFQTGVGSKSKPCTKIFRIPVTSPRRLCEQAQRELPKKTGEQLVILSQVLMDDINVGYERLAELQVTKVNGVEVENLKHLCSLVEGCTEENLRFHLDDERVIILKYQNARLATSRILKRHRIQTAMSTDLIDEQATNDVIDRRLPGFVRWLGRLLFGSQF